MRAVVDKFAKTHPRFDELVVLMEPIIQADARVDLPMAYAIATMLRPTRREAIERAFKRLTER